MSGADPSTAEILRLLQSPDSVAAGLTALLSTKPGTDRIGHKLSDARGSVRRLFRYCVTVLGEAMLAGLLESHELPENLAVTNSAEQRDKARMRHEIMSARSGWQDPRPPSLAKFMRAFLINAEAKAAAARALVERDSPFSGPKTPGPQRTDREVFLGDPLERDSIWARPHLFDPPCPPDEGDGGSDLLDAIARRLAESPEPLEEFEDWDGSAPKGFPRRRDL